MKKSLSRRTVLGLVSATVVIGMTGVTTWAVADVNSPSGPTVQLVVGVKHGADAAAAARQVASMSGVRKSAAAATTDQKLAAIDASTLGVAASEQAKVIAKLKRDPNVDYVEVAAIAKKFDVSPNDPMYTSGRQPETDRLHLPTAWETTTGSASVTVAVVDTGVSAVGDLAGAVSPGHNFVNGTSNASDDEGHGTQVSSIVAGRGNNSVGLAGACWSCRILPVKVLDSTGSGSASQIAAGIVYAADSGAKIINLSLGFEPGYSSAVVGNAVDYANRKGSLVVAAAGNDGVSTKTYPAAYPYVLAVGGTDLSSDSRVFFSNYGSSWVDVAAPGCTASMNRFELYGTGDPNDESTWDRCGTSFSSPMVAGVAALIKSAHPEYTNWSLQNAILRSARKLSGNWTAFGMVDAGKALTVPADTTKPTLTGFSPADKTLVHGTVTLTAYATDAVSGVRSADLYVDGKWTANDVTSPYQLKYNTAGRNGTIPMQVRISDRAGNVTLINRNLIADNVLPAVSITSAPANNAKVSGKVTIKATASDANGVNRLELMINGKVIQTDKTSPYSFVITASKQPKTMKVQVRAIDAAGNIRYAPTRNWTR